MTNHGLNLKKSGGIRGSAYKHRGVLRNYNVRGFWSCPTANGDFEDFEDSLGPDL